MLVTVLDGVFEEVRDLLALRDLDFEPERLADLVNELEEERVLTSGYTWRFGLMPYGKGNADTRVFPAPASEEPGDAYQFMDMGDYGDYIDRKDNKPEPLRKSRQLFASAYIPPTK